MYEKRHGKICKHYAQQIAHLLHAIRNRTTDNETGDTKWQLIMVILHFKFLWSQETTGKIPSGDVRLNVMPWHPVSHLEKVYEEKKLRCIWHLQRLLMSEKVIGFDWLMYTTYWWAGCFSYAPNLFKSFHADSTLLCSHSFIPSLFPLDVVPLSFPPYCLFTTL